MKRDVFLTCAVVTRQYLMIDGFGNQDVIVQMGAVNGRMLFLPRYGPRLVLVHTITHSIDFEQDQISIWT